jgi:hypothetical protein
VTNQAAGYFVVQLDVPVSDLFLKAAEALGAAALDFIPTHGIIEVMERLRRAAQRGAENFLRRVGRPERGEDVLTVPSPISSAE